MKTRHLILLVLLLLALAGCVITIREPKPATPIPGPAIGAQDQYARPPYPNHP